MYRSGKTKYLNLRINNFNNQIEKYPGGRRDEGGSGREPGNPGGGKEILVLEHSVSKHNSE